MKELQIDPSKLLGFRLSVAEAKANGLDLSEHASEITGVSGQNVGDKLGGKAGGKTGNKLGGKIGGKLGTKGGIKRF